MWQVNCSQKKVKKKSCCSPANLVRVLNPPLTPMFLHPYLENIQNFIDIYCGKINTEQINNHKHIADCSSYAYKLMLPRRQVDHGITVFHCQPWLTMVGHAMTMVSDHGPLWPLTMVHGQPWSGYIIVDIERPCFDQGAQVFYN